MSRSKIGTRCNQGSGRSQALLWQRNTREMCAFPTAVQPCPCSAACSAYLGDVAASAAGECVLQAAAEAACGRAQLLHLRHRQRRHGRWGASVPHRRLHGHLWGMHVAGSQRWVQGVFKGRWGTANLDWQHLPPAWSAVGHAWSTEAGCTMHSTCEASTCPCSLSTPTSTPTRSHPLPAAHPTCEASTSPCSLSSSATSSSCASCCL